MNPQSTSQQLPRPLSARGAALSLADRVALYCRQTSAANNAGVLRSVAKPSAPEMLEFLTREATIPAVYGNPSLVRVLLTDSDYDSVCREVLNLSDAIEWHSQQCHAQPPLESPSTSSALEMMLQSAHVFPEEEITVAKRLARERGLGPVVQGYVERGGGHQVVGLVDQVPVAGGDVGAVEGACMLVECVAQHSEAAEIESDAESSDGSADASEEEDSRPTTPLDVLADDQRAVDELLDKGEGCCENCHQDVDRLAVEPLATNAEDLEQDRTARMDQSAAASEPTWSTLSAMEETSPALGEVAGVPDLADQEPLNERSWELSIQAQSPPDADADRHSGPTKETQDDAASESQATPTTTDEHDAPKPCESQRPQQHTNLHQSLCEAAASPNEPRLATEEPSPAPLWHSASTVERIVRTLDKQLQGPESDEMDASIERAIAYDATILERRHSAIAEEPTDITSAHDLVAAPRTPCASASAEDYVSDNASVAMLQAAPLTPCQESADQGTALAGATVVATESPVVIPLPMFRIGEAVEARYRGWNRYFHGEIAVVVDAVAGIYEVRYADGDYETNVSAHCIRSLARETLELHGRRPTPLQAAIHDPDMKTALIESATAAQIESATTLSPSSFVETHTESYMTLSSSQSARDQLVPSANIEIVQQDESTAERRWRIGDRVHVQQSASSLPLVAWVIAVRTPRDDVYDVLYDAGGGGHRAGEKESGVAGSRLQRFDSSICVDERREAAHEEVLQPLRSVETQVDSEQRTRQGNQTHSYESDALPVTPVLPFHGDPEANDGADHEVKSKLSVPLVVLDAARLLAQVDDDMDEQNQSQLNIWSQPSDEEDDDSGDDSIFQSTALFKPHESVPPSRGSKSARAVVKSTSESIQKPTVKRKKQQPESQGPLQTSVLSDATLRYLTPQPRKPTERPRTGRSQAATTPLVGTATPRKACKPKPTVAASVDVGVSWKELEEWKNVDLILNRKRKIVTHNGHVEGSDVPWGEEFAAIQSLKRFAIQYPDVLRQHLEHQLQAVVNSSIATSAGRPTSTPTSATAAARDALLLIKDLAFLLRHRLAPFLDTILPVVLPAVFHSQKRFLCDTAYQVLEALVAHGSSRKLVVALLNQALRFPRDDMRLVNLTCLYIEKCLASLSFAAVQELMTRSAVVVLEAVADLLGCKSAACQSSLQKSLLLLQQAIGDEAMDDLLYVHLMGNARAIVRKHLALARSAAGSCNKSPSTSPKKLQATPAKQAAAANAAPTGGGSMSILQRMLLQRQNRVVPAHE